MSVGFLNGILTALGLTSTGTTNINTSGAANTNIGTGTNSGTVNIGKGLVVDSTGRTINTVQPAFLAFKTATSANVTGANALYTIIFDSEVFDQNSNYDPTTGIFTAPKTGRYFLSACVRYSGTPTNSSGILRIATTAAIYESNRINCANVYDSGISGVTVEATVFADMTVGDTASVTLQVAGSGASDVAVSGSATLRFTRFQGFLVC
jgi:hypothetical protein